MLAIKVLSKMNQNPIRYCELFGESDGDIISAAAVRKMITNPSSNPLPKTFCSLNKINISTTNSAE